MTAVELCVGAGGLALGAARAGISKQVLIDNDPRACETLRENLKALVSVQSSWSICCEDISGYDFSQHSGVDVVIGGPPCQPFSRGGSRRGWTDKREMLPHLVRAVRECHPRGFLIENVRGLLDPPFNDYFTYVTLQLQFPGAERRRGERWREHRARLLRLQARRSASEPRYNVTWRTLNAADYGVAQRRERVFVVGLRADIAETFAFPEPTHTREKLIFEQWETSEYWDRHGVARPGRLSRSPRLGTDCLPHDSPPLGAAWRTVRDAIGDLPRLSRGRASRGIANHCLNPGARSYAGHEGSQLDWVAKTIKAGRHGVPGGENTLSMRGGRVRYLSVRECARLQSFPDDWVFSGSWCSCMRQVGNAVPVSLAEAVAVPLVAALKGPAQPASPKCALAKPVLPNSKH
ncbi:MAG: DNA (cytosine-5-)-methyltransferase [Acidobacteria bacterium]|nr:MAG: DNA (cytosine-5-)-methyltransferase [Acidobacteriota bacterium]